MFYLGLTYQYGSGREKDAIKSFRWYHKAAEKGDPLSMRALAEAYSKGEGVEKSNREAIRWYRKATDLGDARAMAILAWLHEGGKHGVERSPKKAAELRLEAVESLSTLDMWSLGSGFEYGYHLNEKDPAEALRWYHEAATRGDSYAMVKLAYLYEQGTGTEKDLTKARQWYRKAADRGEESAKEKLKQLGGE